MCEGLKIKSIGQSAAKILKGFIMKRIYETTYLIDEKGNIYNEKTKRNIKGSLDKNGYKRFRLIYPNGETKNVSIHRILMEVFNPMDKMEEYEVNHINGNKSNNDLNNLEWISHINNMSHAVKTDLTLNCSHKGEDNNKAILTEEQVREIRKLSKIGYRNKDLVTMFGVSKSQISSIINYKTWKHISE